MADNDGRAQAAWTPVRQKPWVMFAWLGPAGEETDEWKSLTRSFAKQCGLTPTLPESTSTP